MKKEAMDLRESKEGCVGGGMEGGKTRDKWCNLILKIEVIKK